MAIRVEPIRLVRRSGQTSLLFATVAPRAARAPRSLCPYARPPQHGHQVTTNSLAADVAGTAPATGAHRQCAGDYGAVAAGAARRAAGGQHRCGGADAAD